MVSERHRLAGGLDRANRRPSEKRWCHAADEPDRARRLVGDDGVADDAIEAREACEIEARARGRWHRRLRNDARAPGERELASTTSVRTGRLMSRKG